MNINHQIISLLQNGYLDFIQKPTHEKFSTKFSSIMNTIIKMVLKPNEKYTIACILKDQRETITDIALTSEHNAIIITESGAKVTVPLNDTQFKLLLFANQEIPKLTYTLVNAIDYFVENDILIKSTTSTSIETKYTVAENYMITYNSDTCIVKSISISYMHKNIKIYTNDPLQVITPALGFDSNLRLTAWVKHTGIVDIMEY